MYHIFYVLFSPVLKCTELRESNNFPQKYIHEKKPTINIALIYILYFIVILQESSLKRMLRLFKETDPYIRGQANIKSGYFERFPAIYSGIYHISILITCIDKGGLYDTLYDIYQVCRWSEETIAASVV